MLLIIYLSFISLGLPDSLLGSAWPVMYGELSVPVSWAGIISMIISGGTIISSFFSERIIRRLGTGLVTFVSVAMTAAALLGFALLPGFWWLCLCAIPLGLGAGSVDSALNNFVALHYKAMHMNWLHCFWGIGASLGPVIMSIRLAEKNGWKQGYLIAGSTSPMENFFKAQQHTGRRRGTFTQSARTSFPAWSKSCPDWFFLLLCSREHHRNLGKHLSGTGKRDFP